MVSDAVRKTRRTAFAVFGATSIPQGLLIAVFCAGCVTAPNTTATPSFEKRYSDYDYCAVTVTEQTGQFSCGPACLTTVLNYWGHETLEASLLDRYPSEQEKRYFLVELKQIAEAEGLSAFALSLDEDPYQELADQIQKGRPLICAVRIPEYLHLLRRVPVVRHPYETITWAIGTEKRHYVVVIGLHQTKRNVLVMDPATGFVTIPWRRFERAWSQMEYACLLVSR